MNLSKYSHLFCAAYGYEGLFDWCMYLLDCARNQVLIEHEVSFSEPEFAVAGDYYEWTSGILYALTVFLSKKIILKWAADTGGVCLCASLHLL